LKVSPKIWETTNRKLKIFFTILIVSLFSVLLDIAFAQQVDLDSYFNEGLILYRNQQYEQAKLKFMTAIATPEQNSHITATYLMLAKTYLKLNNPDEAVNYAQTLIKNYPKSRYVGDAYYLIAISKLNKNQKIDAINYFLFAIESSRSKKLTSVCETLASKIIDQGISVKSLEKLFSQHRSKTAHAWLTLWLARTKYGLGQKTEADAIIDEFLATKPEARFANAAKKLKQLDIEALALPVRVGVVLPLTGYFSSEANNMLKGIALALKERTKQSPKIELIVRDSNISAGDALQAMLSLLQNDLSIVIGELEGTRSAALAGLCSQANVPLIVPIATENGIAAIGPMVFQANNDIEIRGSTLAKYAMTTSFGPDSTKMRTFAMLAPADDYGHAMSDAFANTVDSLGGTIVAQQWYYPGSTDFKRQFMAVREAGFRYAFRDTLLKHGIPVRPGRIDSIFNIVNRKTKAESDDKEGLLESMDIPVTSIDGIFLPVYEEDISLIAPQLALANIQARLLGGDNWLNEDELRKQRNYVNGVVFVSGYYISETDLQYRDFVNRFRHATATSPSLTALYGYNIMNLIISAIDAGHTSKRAITEYLETVKNYPGIGGEISFDHNHHVNTSVNILQFQDGNIIRLE